MAVVFSVIDAPYPHVCALYRCPCGAECVRHDEHAGLLPEGWTSDHLGEGDDELVRCPGCSAGTDAARS